VDLEMEIIKVQTSKRAELLNITAEVKKVVHTANVNNGICVVFCPHTTAGLALNENADPSVKKDLIKHLEELVPESKIFSHNEGNSDSHIKTALLGNSVNVIIKDNDLALGTWQAIYFCEFDGPRQREVWIQLLEGVNKR
jgi:secondary thiamine-phosphate synthase enzyme